jgi:hypothetical protein
MLFRVFGVGQRIKLKVDLVSGLLEDIHMRKMEMMGRKC